MKQIFIKDLLKICDAKLVYGKDDDILENFSKDTRTIEKGDIYVGIKGTNFDGNLFYEEAFNKGAKTCIIEKDSIDINNIKIHSDKNLIVVNNSIQMLQELAKYKRSLYNIPVIAVTGSVGKTSTRDMIASVLQQNFKVLKTEGNYNNEIGLPLTILKLKDHNAMVLEMGMSNLGEIKKLSDISKPSIGIITNIGTAHIGNLKSRENILKAKLEITSGFNKDSILIINNDNDLLHKNMDKLKEKYNLITVGINNNSDYMALNIEDDAFSSKYDVNKNKVEVMVGGEAFIYNSLVAYAVGNILNISIDKIVKGIKEFKMTENRLEKIISKSGINIINDTYNASLDSIKNALNLLNRTNFNKKIFLFGDILELGSYTEEIHREVAKEIIKNNINKVILVGNNVKYTKDELLKSNYKDENIYLFNSENETYEFLKEKLKKEDIILLKGSHAMNLINIVNKIKEY